MQILGPQSRSLVEAITDRDGSRKFSEKESQEPIFSGRKWNKKGKEPVWPICLSTLGSFKSQGTSLDPKEFYKLRKRLEQLVTVEEKVSQLAFLSTEAQYDKAEQNEVEKILLTWQIGGILFTKGDFKRQNYLIDAYQQHAKTPLLIGNSFENALSLYFQDQEIVMPSTVEGFGDLARVIGSMNKSLKVDFQFDRSSDMSDEQAKAFRKGIRSSFGLAARNLPDRRLNRFHQEEFFNQALHVGHLHQSRYGASHELQKIKSLNLLELHSTQLSEASLLEALRTDYDGFYGEAELIKKAITLLSAAVLKGHLSESELNKWVMKLLLAKTKYFK